MISTIVVFKSDAVLCPESALIIILLTLVVVDRIERSANAERD